MPLLPKPFMELLLEGDLPGRMAERAVDPPQEVTLVTYGCTTLRINEFPVVRYREK